MRYQYSEIIYLFFCERKFRSKPNFINLTVNQLMKYFCDCCRPLIHLLLTDITICIYRSAYRPYNRIIIKLAWGFGLEIHLILENMKTLKLGYNYWAAITWCISSEIFSHSEINSRRLYKYESSSRKVCNKNSHFVWCRFRGRFL